MSREVSRLLLCWLALLLLLALTVAAAFAPLGPAKTGIGYAIATAKAALILWFFMEMRREAGLVRLAALAGFVWMLLLLTLSGADYLTRDWLAG
ncbi:cytochrome C oxidase subunit IV family protein [Sphingomonas sp. ac-8]|uniref:cytochrome C oxidase subunit IV family protein n=1 Tax=Sphingomonas sp. ac-8 TaxID=3242977 RepID=UPI003A805C78